MIKSKILVICGPMKSGKSKELLMQVDKLEFSKIPYILFKPDIDSRSGTFIKSRYPNQNREAIAIDSKNPQKILDHIDLKSITLPFFIVIDEVQFFDGSIVKLIWNLYLKGINFIIAGLDLDAYARTFGPMGDLLALSTEVMKLTAICENCFAPATNSALKKFDPNFKKNNIKIGDQDLYEVLCARCYLAQSKEKHP